MGRPAGHSQLTAKDIENIEEVAAQPDILQRLAHSLAPSIHGHNLVKAGLVLQLLGGRERILDNGTHLRGDINCLMVGQPSQPCQLCRLFEFGHESCLSRRHVQAGRLLHEACTCFDGA